MPFKYSHVEAPVVMKKVTPEVVERTTEYMVLGPEGIRMEEAQSLAEHAKALRKLEQNECRRVREEGPCFPLGY